MGERLARSLYNVIEVVVLAAGSVLAKDLATEDWQVVVGITLAVLALIKLVELSVLASSDSKPKKSKRGKK